MPFQAVAARGGGLFQEFEIVVDVGGRRAADFGDWRGGRPRRMGDEPGDGEYRGFQRSLSQAVAEVAEGDYVAETAGAQPVPVAERRGVRGGEGFPADAAGGAAGYNDGYRSTEITKTYAKLP